MSEATPPADAAETPRANEGARAQVRPAVYGRNYSYFSHRLFVAFMPEDLHLYLHELLEHDPEGMTPDEAVSERLDTQVIRWLLLHRSQLNALSLNREIEFMRGQGDVLNLPGPNTGFIRSDKQCRTELTLQVAIELELAGAREHWMLRERPRLTLALLDAAYYISRQRAEQDRRGKQAGNRVDIELGGKDGRERFRLYLLQRMNLHEDRSAAIGQAPEDRMSALSDEEIDWLMGVTVGIARTLSAGASASALKRRWMDQVYPHWAARGMDAPQDELFDALLTGEKALLDELPDYVTDAKGRRKSVPGQHFQWREPRAAEGTTSTSPKGLAYRWRPVRVALERVNADLAALMYGIEAASLAERGSDGQPLHMLADRYRVLPTTPAWPVVAQAMENLRQAESGLGNMAGLQEDAQLLQQYAGMLETAPAVTVVVQAIGLAAVLVALQLQSDRTPERHEPRHWHEALRIVSEGLRLGDCDMAETERRLTSAHGQARALLPLLPELPTPATPATPPAAARGPSATGEGGARQAWPTALQLETLVAASLKAVAPADAATRTALLGAAWQGLLDRLAALESGMRPLAPASAAELASAALRAGPGSLLPLRIERAGCRRWTGLLLEAIRWPQTTASERAPVIAAALLRLGWRPASPATDSAAPASVPPVRPPSLLGELRRYLSTPAAPVLEAGVPVAVVLGTDEDTLAESWPLPPRGGLLIALTVAQLSELQLLQQHVALLGPGEALRVATEPLLNREDGLSTSRIVKALDSERFTRIWLYRSGEVGAESPQLIEPRSADELWLVPVEPR